MLLYAWVWRTPKSHSRWSHHQGLSIQGCQMMYCNVFANDGDVSSELVSWKSGILFLIVFKLMMFSLSLYMKDFQTGRNSCEFRLKSAASVVTPPVPPVSPNLVGQNSPNRGTLGISIPTDFHIFQRGWNHQPDNVLTSSHQRMNLWLIPISGWFLFFCPRFATLMRIHDEFNRRKAGGEILVSPFFYKLMPCDSHVCYYYSCYQFF